MMNSFTRSSRKAITRVARRALTTERMCPFIRPCVGRIYGFIVVLWCLGRRSLVLACLASPSGVGRSPLGKGSCVISRKKAGWSRKVKSSRPSVIVTVYDVTPVMHINITGCNHPFHDIPHWDCNITVKACVFLLSSCVLVSQCEITEESTLHNTLIFSCPSIET